MSESKTHTDIMQESEMYERQRGCEERAAVSKLMIRD